MTHDLFSPPAIVRPADDLAVLAPQINAEHQQVEETFKAGLLHARAAGELLIRAKRLCGHGGWIPWLKANVRFSERTAQAYMRVAREWDTLQAKAQHVADLSYRDGLKLLADPAEVQLETTGGVAGRRVFDGRREPPVGEYHVWVGGVRFWTPYAKLLPLASEEMGGLLGSVREFGVHEPVQVDPENRVIDGRARLICAGELRLSPLYVGEEEVYGRRWNRSAWLPWGKTDVPILVLRGFGSDAERQAWVLRSVWGRRNMSPEQKAELRKKLKVLDEGKGKKNGRPSEGDA
jgi:hypothetical protein